MELLEVGEVAARLGVSALRVWQLANDKKLPVAVRTARGRRLADELARYARLPEALYRALRQTLRPRRNWPVVS